MFLPPRLIAASVNMIDATENWPESDGGFYDSFPYRWRVQMNVATQNHGSHRTREPYLYNALDVKVGDWLSDIPRGLACQIIEIEEVSPGGESITVIVEDVDRFNIQIGSDGSGIGSAPCDALIYSLSDEGTPILSPAPAALIGQNASFIADQISRFAFRNIIRSFFRVEQVGHALQVGDVIRIRTEEPNVGTYEKVVGGSSVEGVVGVVNSIGTPGVNWFTFRPSGRVVAQLTPTLPGVAGNLIYLDDNGAYTTSRPSTFAKPIFIRLTGDGSLGLQVDRNVDPLPPAAVQQGYIAQTYIVDDLAARDALTNLNEGDIVKVRNMGNGEWATFIYDHTAWSLLNTQDSSNTDAETLHFEVTETGTFMIGTVSASSRVTVVTVTVTEAFSANATLTVGTDMNPSVLMGPDLSDLTMLASFSSTPAVVFEGPSDTDIKVFVNASGPGRALIAITYA